MNIKKIKEIIESYKKHLDSINEAEIYKWRAVKHFQDNWDINADNFAEMLENSLSYAKNLMDSGQYFPRRMITQYAQMDSEAVKQLFVELYSEDEDKTIQDKWADFHSKAENINKKFFGVGVDKKSYQDHRAFMVYLSLRFPDDYFLFKFRMFKEFVKKVDFPYKPIAGRDANLTVYSELCEMLRNEIIEDNELLELHHGRLTDKHYIESSYNLLTQDIIYATVVHFERFENIETDESIFEKLIRVNKPLIPKTHEYNQNKKSSNAKVDYEKKQRSNKRLGNFGEQLVLKYELEKLKKLGSKKEPEYVAFTDDSQGFDILSFDENDKEIYIEVKTTTQSCEANFFITACSGDVSIFLRFGVTTCVCCFSCHKSC